MSIYSDNLKIMEVINEPDLWKFVEIEQIGPTRASVICKTSAAAGMKFIRAEIQIRRSKDDVSLVLRCKFLGANYEENIVGMEKDVLREALRHLLSHQEVAYYSDSIPSHFKEMMSPKDFYLSMNLNPDWPEVHKL